MEKLNKTDKAFKKALDDLNIERKGFIHAGLGTSFNVNFYDFLGFKKGLLIEANSVCLDYVKKDIQEMGFLERFYTKKTAISNFDGEADFNYSNNPGCSSLLKLGEGMKKYYPKVHIDRVSKIQVKTINTIFLEDNKLHLKDFNVLNIDIQGSELDAIQGASTLIPYLDVINVEVENVYLYKDVPLKEDVIKILSEFKFCPYITTVMDGRGSFDDMIFIKEHINE